MRKKKTKGSPLLIHGVHSVTEAIRSGESIEKMMVVRDRSVRNLKPLLEAAKERGIFVQKLPLAMLDRISDGATHQNVVAVVSPVPYTDITTLVPTIYERGEDPLLLMIDGVTDTGNLGAIIRTAECMGVHALILPNKNTAPINHHTIKASSGAVFHVPMCKVDSLVETTRYLLESGFQVITAVEDSPQRFYQMDYQKPTVVVLGDEDRGISQAVRRLASGAVSIPMLGALGSLNVSVACGIVLSQVVRDRPAQRGFIAPHGGVSSLRSEGE